MEAFEIKYSIKQNIYNTLIENSDTTLFEVFNNILIEYYNKLEELDIDKYSKTLDENTVMEILIYRRAISDALEEVKIEFGYDALHKTLKYRPIIPIKPPRS